jgi:hypothetical protein
MSDQDRRWRAGSGRYALLLTVVQDPAEANRVGGSLLDEIVRDGARQMLAAALRAEVAAYVDAYAGVLELTAAGWWSAMATRSRGR